MVSMMGTEQQVTEIESRNAIRIYSYVDGRSYIFAREDILSFTQEEEKVTNIQETSFVFNPEELFI
jgi:non-homologous end joining protein Ku